MITPIPPPGYRLVWSDEFDGTTVDWSKWSLWPYEGSSNRGSDVVSSDTLSVQNGMLTVTIFDKDGLHHIGLLNTQGKYEARYGYFEARIQFNDSSGQWCAFWLQTPTMGQPLDNTAVAGAEIDVMEHRAYDNSGNYIGESGALNLNWNAYSGPYKVNIGTQVWPPNGVPLQGNWHTYGVLWTDAGYTWFIDGAPVWHNTQGISKRTEYIFLTCEVGNWVWAGGVPPNGYGTLATSTTKMRVDYVRVWQP